MSEQEKVFVPTGRPYTIHIAGPPPAKKAKYSEDGGRTLITIPTSYRLATLDADGFPDPPSANDIQYCCLGQHHDYKFILVETLQTRLQDQDQRKKDYNMMKTIKQEAKKIGVWPVPLQGDFEVWDKNGDRGGLPHSLSIDPDKPFPRWDEEELKAWETIARGAAYTPPRPYDPIARFFSPKNVKNRTFYFTPNTAVFDQKELEGVVNSVVTMKTDKGDTPYKAYDCKVLKDFDTAKNKPHSLKLVGRHFLDFYCTWMKASDYKALWDECQITKLERKFPADTSRAKKPFEDVQEILTDEKVPKDTLDSAPATFIDPDKMARAAGVKRDSNQQKVMNNISATKVAEIVWSDGGERVAEWLHRTAFRYGGLRTLAAPQSAQHYSNLVFGSYECNTHMIRAENTIAKLVRDWRQAGTLVTTNVRQGTLERITTTGDRNSEKIPAWAEKEKFAWLCFRLDYKWKIRGNWRAGGGYVPPTIPLSLNEACTFDPWSRYVPFRLEAEIDDALMDYIYKTHIASDPISLPPS